MQAEWIGKDNGGNGAFVLDESWSRKLESLSRWSRERKIAIAAGSAELLFSKIARQLGWTPIAADLGCGADAGMSTDPEGSGIWILRVKPGEIEAVAQEIEGMEHDGEVAHPTLHLEESVVVHLPCLRSLPRRWPGTESWIRAFHLLEPPRRLRAVFVPRTFEDLVRHLATRRMNGAVGIAHRERPRADVLLFAVDLLRAAVAWETKREAYEAAAASSAHRCTWTPDRRDHQETERGVEVPRGIFSRLSGGGMIPLPLTVFAHEPRPAASRSLEARRS
jgi:hypothetical protein